MGIVSIETIGELMVHMMTEMSPATCWRFRQIRQSRTSGDVRDLLGSAGSVGSIGDKIGA